MLLLLNLQVASSSFLRSSIRLYRSVVTRSCSWLTLLFVLLIVPCLIFAVRVPHPAHVRSHPARSDGTAWEGQEARDHSLLAATAAVVAVAVAAVVATATTIPACRSNGAWAVEEAEAAVAIDRSPQHNSDRRRRFSVAGASYHASAADRSQRVVLVVPPSFIVPSLLSCLSTFH